jgi:hypothetical protein
MLFRFLLLICSSGSELSNSSTGGDYSEGFGSGVGLSGFDSISMALASFSTSWSKICFLSLFRSLFLVSATLAKDS